MQRTEQPLTPAAGARPIKLVDACTNFTERLPSDYVLYAAGEYKRRKPGNQSANSRASGRFDVFVNAPGKNVVVALGAYDAALWNIRWASTTTIAGVFVSGYHTQTVLDLPRDIPVLNTSHESKSPCGYFYPTHENANQADAAIRKIFGRSAQVQALAMDGRIELGTATSGASSSRSSSAVIERYTDENGRTGYRQAVESR